MRRKARKNPKPTWTDIGEYPVSSLGIPGRSLSVVVRDSSLHGIRVVAEMRTDGGKVIRIPMATDVEDGFVDAVRKAFKLARVSESGKRPNPMLLVMERMRQQEDAAEARKPETRVLSALIEADGVPLHRAQIQMVTRISPNILVRTLAGMAGKKTLKVGGSGVKGDPKTYLIDPKLLGEPHAIQKPVRNVVQKEVQE